jgi:hypothetical protein
MQKVTEVAINLKENKHCYEHILTSLDFFKEIYNVDYKDSPIRTAILKIFKKRLKRKKYAKYIPLFNKGVILKYGSFELSCEEMEEAIVHIPNPQGVGIVTNLLHMAD